MTSRTARGGRDGSRRGWKGLALVVGVLLTLAVPVSSMAEQPSGPAELWRAYPLGPEAPDSASHGSAAGNVSRPTEKDPAGAEDTGPDTRLVLQVGMLLALVYVAFVCFGVSSVRRRRALGQPVHRVRALCAGVAHRAVARVRSASHRAAIPPGANSPPTCEIAWKPGHVRSRFQAVIVTPDDRKRRVVAESTGLRWPPKDVRNPPTRELEATLEALISSIVASGWEPVRSPGSWSQRRFVWRRPGEPPTMLRSSRRRPSHVRRERRGAARATGEPAPR